MKRHASMSTSVWRRSTDPDEIAVPTRSRQRRGLDDFFVIFSASCKTGISDATSGLGHSLHSVDQIGLIFFKTGHSAFDMNLKRSRGTGGRLYRAGALVDRALNLPEME
jgi:hypothetical protein